MASWYEQVIRETLERLGLEGQPRAVEAWMRAEHSTLDHLTPEQFEQEVRLAAACAAEAGEEQSRALAESLGL